MDYLSGILIMIIYSLPFIIAGVIVFILCAAFVYIIAFLIKFKTHTFIKVGLVLSFFAGVILAAPVYVFFVINIVGERTRPEDDAMARLKHEMRRDGRDQAWPAGTITELEQWVGREGGEFKEKMRLEVASQISRLIDANKLQTNDSDFIFVEKLANRPYALDNYSVYLVASAIAYGHFNRSGFDDIGHPERFRRAPGHLPVANQTDYTTYIKVAMVRCTQDPSMKGCRETFTDVSVTRFETEPEGANTLNWYERLHVVVPLRAALGYPPLEK